MRQQSAPARQGEVGRLQSQASSGAELLEHSSVVLGAVRGDAGRRRVSLQGPGPLSGRHLAGLSRYGRRRFWPGWRRSACSRGERVAAMSDPCWEFLIADMAALCGGAVCYGIYTTCSVAEVEYQLENGGARFFLAENQEFVDKALQRRGRACAKCARSSCSIPARCSSTATSA